MVLIVLDYTLHLFPQPGRFSIKSIQLFFNHPSRLSFAISFVFIVLYPLYADKGKVFLLMILLLGLVTLRVKYFGFVLIVGFFLYGNAVIFRVKKSYIYSFLALTPIVLFLSLKIGLCFISLKKL